MTMYHLFLARVGSDVSFTASKKEYSCMLSCKHYSVIPQTNLGTPFGHNRSSSFSWYKGISVTLLYVPALMVVGGGGASPITWSTHLFINFLMFSKRDWEIAARVVGAHATIINSSPVEAQLCGVQHITASL